MAPDELVRRSHIVPFLRSGDGPHLRVLCRANLGDPTVAPPGDHRPSAVHLAFLDGPLPATGVELGRRLRARIRTELGRSAWKQTLPMTAPGSDWRTYFAPGFFAQGRVTRVGVNDPWNGPANGHWRRAAKATLGLMPERILRNVHLGRERSSAEGRRADVPDGRTEWRTVPPGACRPSGL
jgi:hypothetical protein